jgi:hypothetical protein
MPEILSPSYELKLECISQTIRRLRDRIAERFPDSGLSKVAAALLRITEETGPILDQKRRPHRLLRVAIWVAIILLVAVLLGLLITYRRSNLDVTGWGGLLQMVESGIQDAIFLGLALYFLATVEARLDRRVSLRELQRLRNIVHIVDMHQLTKDPEHLVSPERTTPSSPVRKLNHFEMSRYLDYCSELLSLCSKIAPLHLQSVNDPVVLSAVNDIENLASNLSNKIWQKIMVINLERRSAGLLPG